MGKFATGVTVASTAFGETTWGMTANAVTSLSLSPPLVLLAVVRESQSQQMFQQAGCFALNILSAAQEALSQRFAAPGPKDFAGLEYTTAITGAPILLDTLGWVDCKLVDTLPGGDHEILVGEIVAGDCRDGEPLLFFSGRYARLTG
jgi:flavin reductase (DIM6/NTAB) family NADH-FMN oxidoreductase RutF